MCPNVRTLDRSFFLSIYQFSFPNYKYDSSLIEHEHEHELHTTYCLITQEGFSYTVFCIPVAVRYPEIGVRRGGSVRSVSNSITGRMLVRLGRVMSDLQSAYPSIHLTIYLTIHVCSTNLAELDILTYLPTSLPTSLARQAMNRIFRLGDTRGSLTTSSSLPPSLPSSLPSYLFLIHSSHFTTRHAFNNR